MALQHSVAGGGTKPGRASSQCRKNKSVVPQLSLGLDVTTRSDLPSRARVEDELSAEFLPAHDTAALRIQMAFRGFVARKSTEKRRSKWGKASAKRSFKKK